MPELIELLVNGKPHGLPAGLSIAELLEHLELNPKQVAVEVNLQVVPRESHATHRLAEGDTIEVMTFVGGG